MTTPIIMLDVDGVVVSGRTEAGEHWSTSLSRDLALDYDMLRQHFFSPHWEDIIIGKATLRERLGATLARHAPHLTADILIDYWFRNDAHLDAQVCDHVRQLRREGYSIHLATNQEHERVAYLRDVLGLGRQVDGWHYSAAIGYRKPDIGFFRAVEERVGRHSSELLLVDDSQDNVQAALSAGWKALHWRPGSNLHDAVTMQSSVR